MGRSSPRGATPSPPLPRGRLSVTSRRSCATSPWTSSRRCPPPPPPPPWRSPTSFPTARSSPSATRGSGAPRPSSSPASWEWRPAASTRPPTTPSRSATLTSGRTCTPTPSCPEAPPCTPVLLTACRRRSPPPPRGSTPSGSEAPSWPPCPPSSRCGSPSRSTTSAAPPSSTGSASKPNDDLQNLDENSKLETFYDAFPLDGGLTVKLLLPSPSFRASLDWPSLTSLFTLFHPKFPSPFPFQQLELF